MYGARFSGGTPLLTRAEMTENTNLIASLQRDKRQLSLRIIRERRGREGEKWETEIIITRMMQRDPGVRERGLPHALPRRSDSEPSFFSASEAAREGRFRFHAVHALRPVTLDD